MVQRLVEFPGGDGAGLIDQKNLAGLTAVGAAEMVEWDEGARWLVGVMSLDSGEIGTEMAEVKEDGEEISADDTNGGGEMNMDDKVQVDSSVKSPSAITPQS